MSDELERLMAGNLPYILVGRDCLPIRPVLLSGSFNPLHRGHIHLLQAAREVTHRDGLLELSVANVDKPSLDVAEVERRLQLIRRCGGGVLTCAPTFLEKAELFPDAWFAMGYDTAVRLLDPAYHPDVEAMLAHFSTLGTRFVVAGRLQPCGFQSAEELAVPSGFRRLFIPIPEALFREDISSTDLRSES